jgi:hypothetical protein
MRFGVQLLVLFVQAGAGAESPPLSLEKIEDWVRTEKIWFPGRLPRSQRLLSRINNSPVNSLIYT